MAHDHHHHAAAPFRPGRSLFRMGLGERLGIAIAISAVLWLAIFWALR